jgi:putative DNA primase/helicase
VAGIPAHRRRGGEGAGLTAEHIARELGCQRVGPGRYMALCPAHEDHDPSLSVTEKGGNILLKCFAGCSQSDVIAALRSRGLWPERERQEYPQKWGTLAKIFDYADERGKLLYQVCRFEPKIFRPRYSDGRGGWIWKKHPRQVLYHLPEVLEAPIVFVCEGEKDCEMLRSHGFVATTNAGGCNAPWLLEFTATLAGREVILIPDRDRPGKERVIRIARALLGKVARLVILELEDGKDASEWFQRGHSELELIAQVESEEVTR